MARADRIILVTGAATGIGAACCRRMAGPGTAILVHTRKNAEGAEHTAEAVRAKGGTAHVVLGDIADPATPAALVAAAQEHFGGLDVVVANAGFADKTPLLQTDDAQIARTLDTVLWAFIRLARAALPVLTEGHDPRLIAISSFVAHSFRNDVTVFPATSAAKAAVEALVRGLAIEYAPKGVTVNAVAPGFTQKDPGAHAAYSPAQWEMVKRSVPLGRLGTPDDVAAAVNFVASTEAAYVTGQVWHVNGGLV
ncbi:SDR family oxidoreductase [Roseococcus sp. SDR]|uniref:SDR family NAD(P)-dependent oxidoreductase n=1 Tax=Roseococcus sp. SDR TaxID=2835532 RepID=UPI001BCC9787|nr:SDR family oxidoreductase [Roseococcus sp. SDR]MBS7788864.1 SDR family oxidoreductase [Roseococcus sp. SDR]MBV1844178.1 SDR family oxidoreductase [Roseococcus sp. SDR]